MSIFGVPIWRVPLTLSLSLQAAYDPYAYPGDYDMHTGEALSLPAAVLMPPKDWHFSFNFSALTPNRDLLKTAS